MIKVNVTKSSYYPVKKVFVRNVLKKFLKEKGIASDTVVDVSFVSKAKMLTLGKMYLNEKDAPPHNVLSFTASESKENFIYPPNATHLGEIVVCYPVVVEESKRENKLIDEKVEELVTHGALHLLGVHHN